MTKYAVFLTYSDETEIVFNVEVEGTDNEKLGALMMIVRGTLMASGACKATAYNEEGFDVVSYVQ